VERIRFYYDVVCPYSYMESHVVEAAEDEGRLDVEWLPFELRPAPKPLLEVRGDHLRTDWTDNVYRRALAAGVEIHLPRYQPRSTLIVAACLWAEEHGRLRAFKHALYEAFFCEGLDIATDGEIARAAANAGLDPTEALVAAYDPARGARLREIRREAEAAGVAGVPTLLTDDGRTHWGMGGVERLLADEPLVPRVTA
jgi:predicted DsbA family dithiol-disulfide isomerase